VQKPNSDQDGMAADTGTGEFEAIAQFRRRFEAAARARFPAGPLPPRGQTWIGDDAAVITPEGTDPLVLATDLVVAGVHVDLDLSSLGDVGYKALMVTLSDLAAMGARADYALVSVAAPRGTDLDALGQGLALAAADTACVVVGGDLSESRVLVVSTAAMGTLRPDPGPGPAGPAGPLLRSGAAPGDHLFVTGPLGGSAAGLRQLRTARAAARSSPLTPPASSDLVDPGLARAHRRPQARLDEGETARRHRASAAIDVSDGLLADAGHLARASGVGLELTGIPAAPGATAAEALQGGEEYELVIATPDPDLLTAAFHAAGLRAPIPIGRCTDHPEEYTVDGRPVSAGGWQHHF
jgi:thiamine-monophosphate kinase